jgi:hypothetical protein
VLKSALVAKSEACDITELSPFFFFTAFHGHLHLHSIIYNQIHEFIKTLELFKLAS